MKSLLKSFKITLTECHSVPKHLAHVLFDIFLRVSCSISTDLWCEHLRTTCIMSHHEFLFDHFSFLSSFQTASISPSGPKTIPPPIRARTNPTFFAHFHQKPTLQNDNPLNTSISLTFAPIGFETQKQNNSHFVDMSLCNPICDTSLTMVWGLRCWHYKMASQLFFQTATSTKWQTWGDKQPPLSHLDLSNLSKQFLGMLHPSLPFFIHLY